MLLPRSEPVFEGLRTSFLRFDGLLAELRSDGHSGFVSVEFPGYSGAILIDGGDAISATEVSNGVEGHGSPALKGIVARACDAGGTVGVYRLSKPFVQVAATVGTGSPVYRDLSSSFTSLERLLTRLQDAGFDGYIEAVFAQPAASGLVFLSKGTISQAIFAEGGDVVSGDDAVDRIVDEAAGREATYAVFQTAQAAKAASGTVASESPATGPSRASEPTPSQVTVISGPLAVWSEILRRSEEVVDGMAQKGTFAAALHEAFAERAILYPYLAAPNSPFAYEGGQATFQGEVPDSLPDALSNCLHDVMARLAFRLKRSDIESRIRAELADIRSRHAATVQGFPASARSLVS